MTEIPNFFVTFSKLCGVRLELNCCFNVAGLSLFDVGDDLVDLRPNIFQERGNDEDIKDQAQAQKEAQDLIQGIGGPMTRARTKKTKEALHHIMAVATYPSAGGRREGSQVRLPREEGARSRHQRLFKENVRKTGKGLVYELLSVKGSGVVFMHREGISTPRVCHKGRQPFNQVCKYDFKMFHFPLFMSFCVFMPFLCFYLFVVDKGVSLAPTYSSICDKEIRPT